MKHLIIALVALVLSGCATGLSQQELQSGFTRESDAVTASFNRGEISVLQREQAYLDLTYKYFPADALLIGCKQRQLYLVQDFLNKKIDGKTADDRYIEITRQCNLAVAERNAGIVAQDAERQRMREAAAGAAFLNGVGRGFANAYGQNVGTPAQPNYGYQPGGGCIYKAGVLVCP